MQAQGTSFLDGEIPILVFCCDSWDPGSEAHTRNEELESLLNLKHGMFSKYLIKM